MLSAGEDASSADSPKNMTKTTANLLGGRLSVFQTDGFAVHIRPNVRKDGVKRELGVRRVDDRAERLRIIVNLYIGRLPDVFMFLLGGRRVLG